MDESAGGLSGAWPGDLGVAGLRLADVLRKHAGPDAEPETFRLQAVLGMVDGASLKMTGYRCDAEYFYPASSIKPLAAAFSLRELSELVGAESAADARLEFERRDGGWTREDTSNAEGRAITARHLIRRLCLVSDNPAYNLLYDLVGHERMNRLAWERGLSTVRLTHHLSAPRPMDEYRRSPRVRVGVDGRWEEIPARESSLVLPAAMERGLRVGEWHVTPDGERRDGPMDFSAKNRCSLADLQRMLTGLVRPEVWCGVGPTGLTEPQCELVVEAMTQTPVESSNPRFDASEYPETWGKLFLAGVRRAAGRDAAGVRVASKFGEAYGFTIENAYVTAPGRVPFFLAATIYTNRGGVVGGDSYEYASVARPVMDELAERVARGVWA